MKNESNKVAQIAMPFRQVFRDFFKSTLCNDKGEITQSEKTKLARYLKQSESQVEKIIYYGLGGFDPIVAIFEYCLKRESKDAAKVLKNTLLNIKKNHHLLDKADEKWLSIPLKKRRYYMAVIEAAELLEKKLLK